MNQHSDQELSQLALKLLQRVDVKGVEVPAAFNVMAWLEQMATGANVTINANHLKQLQAEAELASPKEKVVKNDERTTKAAARN